MEDITKNIQKVLIVFLLLFVALISYIAYFEVFKAPQIVQSQYNQRLWVKRNEVLRGTIYDRNMTALTDSQKVDSTTQKRTYLGGALFAHVLGYVDPRYGITGLEKKYDTELTTDSSGMLSTVSDKLLALLKGQKPQEQQEKGDNLITTLDYNLQKVAFNALGNNRGAVVALNPKTGEILAMVSKPSFDPNNLSASWSTINTDPSRPLLNRAVSGLYPPGSTFKTITAVSALENIGDVMNKRINDSGKLVFNSTSSLSNFQGEALGNIDFKDAYVHSSNVYFGTLGMELKNAKLKKTAEDFYFNKDVPGDGIVVDQSKFPSLKSYEIGNQALTAIGQGQVLASPMQMALVASTIANGGIMMEPMLISQVQSSNGTVINKVAPKEIAEVTSVQVANTMKDFMRAVVASGTGQAAAVNGIQVCGKTGTADHDNSQAPPHSWFIGFAPYDNPQIAVAVIVEDGGQGGIAAANIASQVIKTDLVK